MKYLLSALFALALLGVKAEASNNPQPITNSTAVSISSVSTAGNGTTITVSTATGTGAYSTGYLNYLSHVHIEAVYTGGLSTNLGTFVTCTTTGIPNNLSFKFSAPVSTGTVSIVDVDYGNPIAGTAGTNLVLTCPATALMLWNTQISYIQGN